LPADPVKICRREQQRLPGFQQITGNGIFLSIQLQFHVLEMGVVFIDILGEFYILPIRPIFHQSDKKIPCVNQTTYFFMEFAIQVMDVFRTVRLLTDFIQSRSEPVRIFQRVHGFFQLENRVHAFQPRADNRGDCLD
jgi:hypothetical protein